jgi:hypothetical protein
MKRNCGTDAGPSAAIDWLTQRVQRPAYQIVSDFKVRRGAQARNRITIANTVGGFYWHRKYIASSETYHFR